MGNWVALLDVFLVGYFPLARALRVCLTMNEYFHDEVSCLTEVRTDIFVDDFAYEAVHPSVAHLSVTEHSVRNSACRVQVRRRSGDSKLRNKAHGVDDASSSDGHPMI